MAKPKTHHKTPRKAKPDAQRTGNKIQYKTAIGILVFVIVVFSVVFWAVSKNHFATTTSTTTLNGYSNTSSTTINQSATIPPLTYVNASSVSYFITSSEAASLIGPGSSNASEITTQEQLIAYLPPEFQTYGITAEYAVYYNSTANPYDALQEYLITTRNATSAYYATLNQSSYYFNSTGLESMGATNVSTTLNATLDGMLYSFSGTTFNSTVSSSNTTEIDTMLLGVKGNEVIQAFLYQTNVTKGVNATTLASMVSGHLG